MLYPYIKEQYESLHREIQGLKNGQINRATGRKAGKVLVRN